MKLLFLAKYHDKIKDKNRKAIAEKDKLNSSRNYNRCKEKEAWKKIAEILSSPRRKRMNVNIEKINKEAKIGETIVVPGKVLSQGDIDKKIKIVAVNFSEKAKEKLLKAKCDVSDMLDEIKKNPDAKGIKILTNIK